MDVGISLKNITREFKTKQETFVAVNDVSFSVNKGEIFSIVGPNGAGKTTLVKMLSNYLLPTSGEIMIDEVDVLKSGFKNIDFSVVFGGEQGFYNNVSALDNLLFFARIQNVSSHKIKENALSALKRVNLSDVASKHVGKFSRGMKQRLHIARAIVNDPSYILLDEPTIGLDVEIAYEIRKLIHELRSNNTTVILTSHDMSEIESLADRILILGAGQVHFIGKTDEFITFVNDKMQCSCNNLTEAYLQYSSMLKR